MTTMTKNKSDVAILGRIIHPQSGDLAPAAVQYLLELEFDAEDDRRMEELAAKVRNGSLSDSEEEEINDYERAGQLLGMLHAKAKLSLKRSDLRR